MSQDIAQGEQGADMPFAIGELFYSRTDKRGIIAAGNAVFQRISGFYWEQLLGAPHNIVRSPDTPRAIFRTLWEGILQNRPMVAYIRNKTMDGRGYWVIATVMPTENGFLSVRIKPTSPIFDQIKPIYAALAEAEREGLSVEESQARLVRELAALGFPSYESFMTRAVVSEYRSRALTLSPRMKPFFADLDRIVASLNAIGTHQIEVLRNVELLRDLPTNMRIIASRLEPSGGPLTAMSDIYSATSSALFGEIAAFSVGDAALSRRMLTAFEQSGLFKICALLQAEVNETFSSTELADLGINPDEEMDMLTQLSLWCNTQEAQTLHASERLANDLNRAAFELRRSMLGLDTIRVMGLVESGRLGAEGARIAATMDQIGTCHNDIISHLQQIKDHAAIVQAGIVGLRLYQPKQAAIAAR